MATHGDARAALNLQCSYQYGKALQRPARAGEPPPFPSPLRTSACVPATTGGHVTPPLC